ncbi:MAG TPA: LysR family transcriptional regulator ArgP [Pseudolysinimonas sp.]|jgi:LysR family transcriptional regulator (chromosome initiation inhibitor)
MRFDREQLETVAVVVAAGTFEAAAARLAVTPSAVSQRIKALEQQLGRVVVVRSKPIRATESGAALLRLAQQLAVLEQDAVGQLGLAESGASVALPLAVNADSLATWLLPALAEVAQRHPVVFDLHRDDEEYTAGLLVDGTVMAAVTADSRPVAGCTVTPLGRMTYRAVATREFVARWFPDGVTAAALAIAPVVDFDRKDELQSRFLRSVSRKPLAPPRHRVPASADFAAAVGLGMGWGMLPDAHSQEGRRSGALVTLDPRRSLSVPLYWQQWNLRSAALDLAAGAVIAHAHSALE